MPVTTLLPVSDGNDNVWGTIGAGASKAARVTDGVDTQFLNADTGSALYQSLHCGNLPSEAVRIKQVDLYFRCARQATGAGNRGLGHRDGSTRQWTEAWTIGWPLVTWGNITKANVSALSGKWTVAKVNALQMLVGTNGLGTVGVDARWTEGRVTVQYYTNRKGRRFLLAGFLLPLIGGALTLDMMPALNRELRIRSRAVSDAKRGGRVLVHPGYGWGACWLDPSEYEAAFRDWQEWRRPAFAF